MESFAGLTIFLIHGRNDVEDDARIRAVLFRLQRPRLTLSIQRCEFSQGRLKFLRYIFDARESMLIQRREKQLSAIFQHS